MARGSCTGFGWAAVAAAAVMVAQPAAAAQAEKDPNPFDRGKADVFQVSLGGFIVDFDTDVQIDSDILGEGTEVSLEDDLGAEANQNTIRVEGYWRFARKHRLDFTLIRLQRDTEKALERQIQIGDQIYEAGLEVRTDFGADMFKLGYRYSFFRKPWVDFGFSAGLSTFDFSLEVVGEATAGQQGAGAAEGESIVAPVPTLGVHAEFRLAKPLFLRVGDEIFDLSVDQYDALLNDFRVSLDWYPFRHFGFGAEYNSIRIEFQQTDQEAVVSDLELNLRFSGLSGYVSYIY